MPAEITMPQLSDTMTEGTIVKWNKKEGDKVRAGEEIAEVETDKATMPMEAFESGTLAVIVAPEGTKVPVGAVMGVIASGKENAADVKNIAGNRDAGSIIGAQFLQRFVNNVPWAHLDIAGVTWAKKDSATVPKGSTAFGVRLLDRLVAEHYES